MRGSQPAAWRRGMKTGRMYRPLRGVRFARAVSATPDPGLCVVAARQAADRGVTVVRGGQHAVERRDLEDAPGRTAWQDDEQLALDLAHPAQTSHEHAERGG